MIKALELSLSDLLLPVSSAKPTVGFAIVVSTVKAKALEVVLTLPATSVCCTVTDLLPSPVKVRLLPLPAAQVLPASVL